MDTLACFPVEQIKITSSGFGGSVCYNPYAQLPPCLWYGVSFDLGPIDLGDAAIVEQDRPLQTTLEFGGIVLPQRRWNEIHGSWGPIPDVGQGSVYVSGVHNPVEILRIDIRHLTGIFFRIRADLLIDFEFEGSGFENTHLCVEATAEYGGVSFHVPQWTHPDEVRFPPEWRIPTVFDDKSVLELLGRFVDLDCYELRQKGHSYVLEPRV